MPDSWIEWVLVYLLSGALLLSCIRFYNDFIKKKDDESHWVKDVLISLEDPKSKSLDARQVAKLISFVMLVLLVWPFAMAVAVKETIFPARKDFHLKPEDYFKCKKDCLVKKVIPQEVEAQSMVLDPKGRAPSLPFGHLQPGWIKLLSQLEPGDSLWSFKTHGWNAPKGEAQSTQWSIPRGVVSGFAVVRNGKVKAEFLTEWD